MPHRSWFLLVAVAYGLGCAPSQSAGREGATASGNTNAGAPARTLVAAIRAEPTTISARGPADTGVAQRLVKAVFNSELAMLDDRAAPQPYLAAELPRLHTDSWKVLPDGRMETTWVLRPNLVWHDGTALAAE